MNTLGLVFLLGGFLLGRQVVVGRVRETPSDIRDVTLALLSGDFDTLQRTLAQRGENVSPDVTSTVAADTSGETPVSPSGDLLAQVVALGSAARGYVWGASGPTFYDCSGLVWQGLKATGQYKGARFTTSTFTKALGGRAVQVPSPSIGDVVLWPGHHMGVYSATNQIYSAMSPTAGIGYSSVSSVTKTVGVSPVYYRVNG